MRLRSTKIYSRTVDQTPRSLSTKLSFADWHVMSLLFESVGQGVVIANEARLAVSVNEGAILVSPTAPAPGGQDV
jgi:hypothetical protein